VNIIGCKEIWIKNTAVIAVLLCSPSGFRTEIVPINSYGIK
jgi:hypothetical protein